MQTRSRSSRRSSASPGHACARDGAVVVHSEEPGYRSVVKLWAAASELVGT
jgi:hypothetical protein